MLSAKIKDEPVNQIVSCKSSFAFVELNGKRSFRDSETPATSPKRAPQEAAGPAAGLTQRAAGGFVQGLDRVCAGFIHSSAGEDRRAGISLEKTRVWSRLSSPLAPRLQNHPERIRSRGTS